MLTRAIPSTGEQLPVLGLGTWLTFDVSLNPTVRQTLSEVVRGLFDGGGTLIDSSPMYGNAEDVVGDLLSGMGLDTLAARPFFATKVWTEGRRDGIRSMERSMALMGTDVMDLMQVHNLLDCDTQLDTLRGWKAEGRVRYIGITHYTHRAFGDLADVLRRTPIDFVQFPYSIGVREAEQSFLPLCADLGVATLINRPLEQQGLINAVRGTPLPGIAADVGCQTWGQYFLKYLLSDPAVTCVIPATANPAHMAENVAAASGALPDAGQRAEMAKAFDRL